MNRHEKVLQRVLRGDSDANIRFKDLCQLLLRLGFEGRVRGGHHIFSKLKVDELVNLQRDGAKAKVYQVRQVRTLILEYELELP